MSDGERLFAQYAYAPNELGYCGPAETAALFELAAGGSPAVDVRDIARRFSGAWPYAELLAELAGLGDPLDALVQRAYWTGGALLDGIDRDTFGRRLLQRFGAQAGHYWAHLTPELLPEVAPSHAFHVLGVYPWSRLLVGDTTGHPLHVLDSCRIRWGRVVAASGEQLVVRSRRLTWDGRQLALGDETEDTARHRAGGRGFVHDAAPGDWVAVHWDWVCDRLTGTDVDHLRRGTEWQLDVTNARLARAV